MFPEIGSEIGDPYRVSGLWQHGPEWAETDLSHSTGFTAPGVPRPGVWPWGRGNNARRQHTSNVH